MTKALKTEWMLISDEDSERLALQVKAIALYCVGDVRVSEGTFISDDGFKFKYKLEYEVDADTEMYEFEELVDCAYDELLFEFKR